MMFMNYDEASINAREREQRIRQEADAIRLLDNRHTRTRTHRRASRLLVKIGDALVDVGTTLQTRYALQRTASHGVETVSASADGER
jgi:hypothetical protein